METYFRLSVYILVNTAATDYNAIFLQNSAKFISRNVVMCFLETNKTYTVVFAKFRRYSKRFVSE